MWPLLTLIMITYVDGQLPQLPQSPCPYVFVYEPPSTTNKRNRWYGVISLSTDVTLTGLVLKIGLDSKADILGNWEGDVITKDNTNFRIENNKKTIEPGLVYQVRVFVQFSNLNQIPILKTIRFNGRELCDANNSPLPAFDRPSDSGHDVKTPSIPSYAEEWSNPVTQRPSQVPNDGFNQRPVQNDAPIYSPIQTEDLFNDRNPPYNPGGFVQQQPAAPSRPVPTYEDQDYSDDNPAKEDDYWDGGLLAITNAGSAAQTYQGNVYQQVQCGQVPRQTRANPLVVHGRSTLEAQWPWHVALYRAQTVNSKYVCGGTLISQSHVVTAAHCVTHKWSKRLVNKNILTVHLGKHNLRTSTEGVQIRFINRIIVHDEYNPMTFEKDAGILELRERVQFTDWIQPVCLWPADQIDLYHVVGKRGIVVGWGFNSRRMLNEELTLVEMPIVDRDTCVQSYRDFFSMYTSDFTYCAGFRNGSATCNGDSGGGMVLYMRGSWYIRGIVTLAVRVSNEYFCDPNHYVVFTDLAKLLPWIKRAMGIQ